MSSRISRKEDPGDDRDLAPPSGGRAEGEGSAIESVPDAVRDAARSAFDARRPSAVVADLVYDSLVDTDRRADHDVYARRLRFGSETAGLDLSVEETSDGLSASLVLLPPQGAEVEITVAGSDVSMTRRTDAHGRATFAPPEGLVSFVVRPLRAPGAATMQTAWIRL